MDEAAPPLVSVIVPVFNGARYLCESLDSIVHQSYPRLEVLVMDDASTDATPEIVSSYGNRIKSYRQPRNRGQFGNVNDGIAMAQGEFIAVYHADDVYAPIIVEKEVEFLRRYPEAGAVFSLDVFIDAEGREYGRLEIPPELRGRQLLRFPLIFNALLTYKNRFLCGPSSMVRALAYREVGVYRGEEFGIAADLEMWMRIAQKYPIGILEQHLMWYRHGHGNSSQQYFYLRTETECHFQIMDLYLEHGGKAIATVESLKTHEAHRAEDRLMISVNNYILAKMSEARTVLSQVRAAEILASDKVQSRRLLILLVVLKILVHLPRIPLVAQLFHYRWHLRKTISPAESRFFRWRSCL